MRFNDTLNHQVYAGGGGGTKVLVAANVTASAVVFRVFNVPDAGKTTLDIASVDQDNALHYGESLPANETWCIECDARYPIIVYNATGNAINWSVR